MTNVIQTVKTAAKKTSQALARVFTSGHARRESAYERYLNGAVDVYDLEARERQWNRRNQQRSMF